MIGYLIFAGVWVVLDQAVKFLVRATIPLHASQPFLPGLFDLTYVRNTGAAFSILSSSTWILTVLSGVATAVLLVLVLRRALPSRLGMLSLSLLLAGAAGNFIDRLAFGYVTDMFETVFMDFPVFNVADIGVVIGGFLLVLAVLLAKDKEEGK